MGEVVNNLINILAENLLGENEFENINKEQSDIKKFILSMLFLPNEKYKEEAKKILIELGRKEDFRRYIKYFEKVFDKVSNELERNCSNWESRFDRLETVKDKKKEISSWFFPENTLDIDEETIKNIRDSRRVQIIKFNDNAIKNPFKQILFTSNILLTMPKDFNKLPKEFADKLDKQEEQEYWFDHPIPLDIEDSSNEIIYGLSNLNKAVKIETEEKLNVVLCVSCTHPSIKKIAKEYIKSKLKNLDLSSLNIYIFTEDDTKKIIKEIFEPILGKDSDKIKSLYSTFGVDGNYGRHYSFLKAIASLWNVLIDENIIATYKIDLDQVFPQKRIYKETGSFSFEKLKNSRWGAIGKDKSGNTVKLGMVAGALVNDKDFDKSIYEPDVKKPSEHYTLDQYIFNSHRPQYISTIAEMGTLYKTSEECIMRFHVTGGMNGILVEDLNKFRPFTPRFITRAEDQAYIISTLYDEKDGMYLRCYHQDHFIMRHDKETFLCEDLKEFEIPKHVGDYERIMLFSHYANDILKDFDRIKKAIYPFTGCFITQIPYTITCFRALFKAYELAKENERDAKIFLDNIVNRMPKVYEKIESGYYLRQYNEDKEAWNIYYDILANKKTSDYKDIAWEIVKDCKVN
ncbi:hypothetical protein [Caloranaerobacter ferrireducens]|uniref:hypothetical protein n=1 Tax=Caloranaerobacter ferrireducens TaxID=1323370 RepID=UPI00084D1BFD|nr:hypothetical protein [Caloranaerobacter ferrireducens]